MEVRVDHVYRGEAGGATRQFKSRIGEWGPGFPVTAKQIVVSEKGGKVSWSFALERNGRIFIDPKRLRSIGGVSTSPVLIDISEAPSAVVPTPVPQIVVPSDAGGIGQNPTAHLKARAGILSS
jgi:hypothetical protein